MYQLLNFWSCVLSMKVTKAIWRTQRKVEIFDEFSFNELIGDYVGFLLRTIFMTKYILYRFQ